MAYARHHGFPSPLIDWTRSLYVALYFAFYDACPDGEVAIFVHQDRPEGGKSNFGGAPYIEELGEYISTHPRHYLQQSQYSICICKPENIWTYASHEDFFQNHQRDHQNHLTKFILPGCLKESVLEKLSSMNINSYSLFANEEGLFNTLAWEEMIFKAK